MPVTREECLRRRQALLQFLQIPLPISFHVSEGSANHFSLYHATTHLERGSHTMESVVKIVVRAVIVDAHGINLLADAKLLHVVVHPLVRQVLRRLEV